METKYFYTDINLDITHRCVLQCPRCLRQQHPGLHKRGSDISINAFTKICDHFYNINFCGQMGDCIYHPKFLEILDIAYNKNVNVKLHTNGHGKKEQWWREAFKYDNIEWIFALDGLPSDSHKYRINQDGNQVFEMMKLGASVNANINWSYIVFKYNEDNIEEAKQLANKYGIKFNMVLSSRWEDKVLGTDVYKPTKYFLEDFRTYETVS